MSVGVVQKIVGIGEKESTGHYYKDSNIVKSIYVAARVNMDCLKSRINSENYCKAKEFRLWSKMINIIQKTQGKIKIGKEKRKKIIKENTK